MQKIAHKECYDYLIPCNEYDFKIWVKVWADMVNGRAHKDHRKIPYDEINKSNLQED